MKAGGTWIVLGTLILVAVLGFAFVELLQRHRFDRMREQVEAVVYSLEGTKLGRDADGFVFLSEGDTTARAKYQAGLGHNLEERDRWIQWSLQAKSLNDVALEDFWREATVILMLRQDRKGFLRNPRVWLIMPNPPPPAIAARFDLLLKARGIDYVNKCALP